MVFDCIEFKCENAKFSCMKRNNSVVTPVAARTLCSVSIDALQQRCKIIRPQRSSAGQRGLPCRNSRP
ncbi:MAG: hypothetical protein CVT85_01475 [Alphaproteobacteria bacterium HGW-Alphaproteobacteria-7]|nr:MAG: hypothetical protein CVT85_01475 [Alphaproteobacteria bacterium HGW-Alphaproteobacteria-7]